jgi:hypothetical protein
MGTDKRSFFLCWIGKIKVFWHDDSLGLNSARRTVVTLTIDAEEGGQSVMSSRCPYRVLMPVVMDRSDPAGSADQGELCDRAHEFAPCADGGRHRVAVLTPDTFAGPQSAHGYDRVGAAARGELGRCGFKRIRSQAPRQTQTPRQIPSKALGSGTVTIRSSI